MMVNFLKTLKPPISGESSTEMSYLGPPPQLQAGILYDEKEKKLWLHARVTCTPIYTTMFTVAV